MQIEDLPGSHHGAEVIRSAAEDDSGKEAAEWFEARYIQLIKEEDASKDDARKIAVRELQERQWEKKSNGSPEHKAQIAVFKHETQIRRDMADIEPPDEDDPESNS